MDRGVASYTHRMVREGWGGNRRVLNKVGEQSIVRYRVKGGPGREDSKCKDPEARKNLNCYILCWFKTIV